MRWIKTHLITTVHGFSTRHGGISPKPFESLNLGGTDDTPEHIAENRKLALNDLEIRFEQVSYLNQIHSCEVRQAAPGKQTGDALVTNQKGLAIAVGAADCYPLLFHDATNGVIGAAHCGWRGTLGRIAANTIRHMVDLGAETGKITVAIGPGISRQQYEVSEELIGQFSRAGFPEYCWSHRQLDLLSANRFVVLEAGISADNVWSLNRCTTETDFFSYRRDQGKTGRLWGVIMLK